MVFLPYKFANYSELQDKIVNVILLCITKLLYPLMFSKRIVIILFYSAPMKTVSVQRNSGILNITVADCTTVEVSTICSTDAYISEFIMVNIILISIAELCVPVKHHIL